MMGKNKEVKIIENKEFIIGHNFDITWLIQTGKFGAKNSHVIKNA